MASGIRRWEEVNPHSLFISFLTPPLKPLQVTQQVAYETKEMAQLVKDLAAASFASRPPSATVRDMLPAEDQARFRDQLLRATQLSLKADLVRTLEARDSEERRQRLYCVVVLAVAVVAAAFLVSPFAARVVGWVDLVR